MKKNNPYIIIDTYEDLLFSLSHNTHNDIRILNYYLIHNIGIEIINTLLIQSNYYKQYKIVFDCGDSLSYTLFAIENQIPHIIYNKINKNNHLATLDKKHNSLVVKNIKKIIEYFKNID